LLYSSAKDYSGEKGLVEVVMVYAPLPQYPWIFNPAKHLSNFLFNTQNGCNGLIV
jgi:hypothetical protein